METEIWKEHLQATSEEKLEALREAFREEDGWPSLPVPMARPSLDTVEDFALLIRQDLPEQVYQKYLERHSEILVGFSAWADDSVLAFFSRPRFSLNWTPDFAVLAISQGGAYLNLIEIERPGIRVFLNDLTFSQEFRQAVRQVTEWRVEVEPAKVDFCRKVVAQAMELPDEPCAVNPNSYRLRVGYEIKMAWEAFGGFDTPSVNYVILAGRWSRMNDAERSRFIHINTSPRAFDVHTFHQVIRHSYLRAIGLGESC